MHGVVFRKTLFRYSEMPAVIGPVIFGNAGINWPFLTKNFYISSYICPECGENMMKTVFHKDFAIETEEGVVKIPRIFACGRCKTLHAPRPGYKLSSNNGFFVKLDSSTFERFVYYLDEQGSTVGRTGTLFNEKF